MVKWMREQISIYLEKAKEYRTSHPDKAIEDCLDMVLKKHVRDEKVQASYVHIARDDDDSDDSDDSDDVDEDAVVVSSDDDDVVDDVHRTYLEISQDGRTEEPLSPYMHNFLRQPQPRPVKLERVD